MDPEALSEGENLRTVLPLAAAPGDVLHFRIVYFF